MKLLLLFVCHINSQYEAVDVFMHHICVSD